MTLTYYFRPCAEKLSHRVLFLCMCATGFLICVLGVTYVDATVVDLEMDGGRVDKVVIQDDHGSASIDCGDVMNAAGPWANDVAQMAGYEVDCCVCCMSELSFVGPCKATQTLSVCF